MSLSLPDPTPAERTQAREDRNKTEKKARGAYGFYRIMAYITGFWLLLLCVELILKYVIDVNGNHASVLGSWVAIAHGIIYVIYVLSVFNLWSVMRWSLSRMVYLVLAGVVPVVSFILERKAHHWFDEDLPVVLDQVEARSLRRAQISRLADQQSTPPATQ